MAAAYGLAEVGPEAREAVPDLLAAPAGDGLMAYYCRVALRRIEPGALAAFDRDHPATAPALK